MWDSPLPAPSGAGNGSKTQPVPVNTLHASIARLLPSFDERGQCLVGKRAEERTGLLPIDGRLREDPPQSNSRERGSSFNARGLSNRPRVHKQTNPGQSRRGRNTPVHPRPHANPRRGEGGSLVGTKQRGSRANVTNGDHLRSLARSHRARVAARRLAKRRDARRAQVKPGTHRNTTTRRRVQGRQVDKDTHGRPGRPAGRAFDPRSPTAHARGRRARETPNPGRVWEQTRPTHCGFC